MDKKQIIPEYLIGQLNINSEDICYTLKLSNIVKRRVSEPAQSKFGGIMSGIGNAINDTISSAMHDTYLVRTNGGMVWVLADNMPASGCRLDEISKNIDIVSENVNVSIGFSKGEVESASFKLNKDSVNTAFDGSIKQMIADFGNVMFENMPECFVTAVVSKRIGGNKAYKFDKVTSVNTLVSYNDTGVTLLNEHKRYEFSRILAYHSEKGYCAMMLWENDEFVLVELFENADSKLPEAEFNLLRNSMTTEDGNLEISFADSLVSADGFMAAFAVKNLAILAVNDKIYSVEDGKLRECGIFKVSDEIYVKTDDGITKAYSDCTNITDALSLLPHGYDSIFMDTECTQPFMFNGEITDFTVSKSCIKNNDVEFEYAKMQDCCYNTDDFSCRISFIYDGKQIGMTTANSLGVYVCNSQEKVFVNAVTNNYNINQLYDCFYKRCTKNFLASTFAEIFKTDKLLNVDCTVDELITAIKADGSEVLRNAFQSMLGKFKNVEDTQSDLLQKVTLLEIQRRKIQKMFDEWLLYYPHYMASIQVKWLKFVFSSNISNDILNNEYWKCVAHYKRILSGGNMYVQKNMNEIGACINRISSALPDDAKRADITDDLRINSNSSKNILNAGTDVLVGVTAGVELANILVRGLTVSSPLTLSLSAKMLVDSYTKDVTLRKNVKAFGLQSLEWWKIFMNGIRIQIIELSNGVNEYNKLCLKRDTELFKKLPEQAREQVKNKLTSALKNKITESIDDKFTEVLPQFNMRISNIIDEIDSNTEFLNVTLDEFKNNLFV